MNGLDHDMIQIDMSWIWSLINRQKTNERQVWETNDQSQVSFETRFEIGFDVLQVHAHCYISNCSASCKMSILTKVTNDSSENLVIITTKKTERVDDT